MALAEHDDYKTLRVVALARSISSFSSVAESGLGKICAIYGTFIPLGITHYKFGCSADDLGRRLTVTNYPKIKVLSPAIIDVVKVRLADRDDAVETVSTQLAS